MLLRKSRSIVRFHDKMFVIICCSNVVLRLVIIVVLVYGQYILHLIDTGVGDLGVAVEGLGLGLDLKDVGGGGGVVRVGEVDEMIAVARMEGMSEVVEAVVTSAASTVPVSVRAVRAGGVVRAHELLGIDRFW